MDPKTRRRRQIGLPLALAISALVHLLLVLASLFLPVGLDEASTAGQEEESLIRFTFAPQTEEEVEGRLEGDLPIPTPPTPQPDFIPEGSPSLASPTSLAPQLPPELIEEELRELAEPEAVEAVAEELEATPASDLPLADDAPLQSRPEPRETADLNRRLQEFGKALDRARAAQPRGPSGSPDARNVFVPDLSISPESGFGVGNLVFESRDYDWNDYARQIYVAIWRAWHNRLYQTVDDFEKWGHENRQWMLNHWTQVRFVIESSGEVTGIVIESPSGCLPLDHSAADALAEVILPPLPADFPRDREVVHARFIAVAEIMALRPGLRRLKMLGYF